jgi:lysophospholipase L1-like esterase
MRKFLTLFIVLFLFTSSVVSAQPKPKPPKVRYVAVGDSYTVGTSVHPEQIWTIWLIRHLKSEGIDVELVANIARSGWTSEDVTRQQIPLLLPLKPNFVTLLVGANDIVQGVDMATFVKRYKSLLDHLQRIIPDPKQVLVITIPDFSVTPYATNFGDSASLHERIKDFNAFIMKEAGARGIKVVDLFEISQEMGKDPGLVSSDGLHPSAREHILWEKVIYPPVFEILKNY